MTSISLVDRSPYAMTTRARVYLGAAGGRHLLIGIALLCVPWLFHSSVYLPIFDFLPLTLWGVIMTVEGIACGAAAAWRNASIARFAIAASAVISLVLGFGLAFGIVATWVEWAYHVDWVIVAQLLAERPERYPLYLMAYGPAPLSPFLPIVMLTLTVKDFTMCAQPLRVPLEESVGVARPRRA